MPLSHPRHPHARANGRNAAPDLDVNPLFARGAELGSVPRFRLPADEMLPETAYQVIHDELMLDGNARMNLATFVTTWMEREARDLMAECFDKNMIDKDEYPQTAELEMRCVAMLADLWHAEEPHRAVGCSTTGSSEAAMLGGLALKRRWQLARRAAGKDDGKPNLIMGANVQVCWEKFANYWDVEARIVPVEGDVFHLRADAVAERCDENTIGVVAVLGSTYDGSYEPVADICAALDDVAAAGGPDVPVHVDGASGGLIAPFLDPDLTWDFRLPRVASINTSGHKYGLVFPGVGWVVWRDERALPEELIFHVSYLGGSMPTFALNFSRSGSQVVGQYYAFLRLGFEGFRRVQQSCRDTAMWLASRIGEMSAFDLVTDGSELPVFAFRRPDGAQEHDGFTVFDVSDELRQHGWQVPAYAMPPNREDLAVLRVVVRNGFGRDLAGLFLADLERSVKELREHPPAPERPARKAFVH